MFFSSTGACTATQSPTANHRSPIIAQLYFASVTQMFMMPLFVKVESDSSKLLRTVSKSGPNGCKERSRPQKMLMRIEIEFFRTTKSSLDGYTLPQPTTGRAKNDNNMNCSHNYNEKIIKSSDTVVEQLLFPEGKRCKKELFYSKSHSSLHVSVKQRRHFVWFHKHKIELKYVSIRLQMLPST